MPRKGNLMKIYDVNINGVTVQMQMDEKTAKARKYRVHVPKNKAAAPEATKEAADATVAEVTAEGEAEDAAVAEVAADGEAAEEAVAAKEPAKPVAKAAKA